MAPLLLDKDQKARAASPPDQPTYRIQVGPHPDPFRVERLWALSLMVVAAAYFRGWNPAYSTAYMDESVYVVYGRMFLARYFESPIDTPLHHSFGWYLWPMMAAGADRLGGIVGVRELGALMGVLGVIAMYNFARRLFTPEIGLAAATIYTFLGPAIYSSRIATRDAGSLGFFTLGMWAYVHAWQEKSKRIWAIAATLLFASFLCKYLVAIFFPALVILAMHKSRQSFWYFTAPLGLASLFYGTYYFNDLLYLVMYGEGYTSLLERSTLFQIYVVQRPDFWIIAALSLLTFSKRAVRPKAFLLWGGALLLFVFQLIVRSDYDYWKHVTYALFFLTPLAATGCVWAAGRFTRGHVFRQTALAAVLIVSLSGGVAWAGRSFQMQSFIFWPNVEPVVTYFDHRLTGQEHVLVDDTVFRYYFHPRLRQWQIRDPFYLKYQGRTGPGAYVQAVRDGLYDYVILDGGLGSEGREVDAAIQPVLPERYDLRLAMPDPVMEQPIRIWVRRDPAPPLAHPGLVQVDLRGPAPDSVAPERTLLAGFVKGAQPHWKIEGDVFTNRWYYQGEESISRDGSFGLPIDLAGAGPQQCYHIVRARVVNEHGQTQATASVFGVVRRNPDGSLPACTPAAIAGSK